MGRTSRSQYKRRDARAERVDRAHDARLVLKAALKAAGILPPGYTMTTSATGNVELSMPPETAAHLAEIVESGEHALEVIRPRGRIIAAVDVAEPDVIICERCGRQTTDPDKWDPEVDTGRIFCDLCWEQTHR
jgi:formylmethanofuran dehydrogenase subunit E